MLIDINFNNDVEINDTYKIPKEYYENSDVVDIEDVKVEGKIYYDNDDNLSADLQISGEMTLLDDISLEEVKYPFSCKYDEIVEKNLINSENMLDLFELLWENIVLEVPLKFTKVTNLSEFHGNGWKLISEEDVKTSNNPFSDLLKDFDKKEW